MSGRKRRSYLTQQETKVLDALIHFNGEYEKIAQSLVIAPTTVKTHLNNLFQKFHVKSKSELILLAIREGLVDFPAKQNTDIPSPDVEQNLFNFFSIFTQEMFNIVSANISAHKADSIKSLVKDLESFYETGNGSDFRTYPETIREKLCQFVKEDPVNAASFVFGYIDLAKRIALRGRTSASATASA